MKSWRSRMRGTKKPGTLSLPANNDVNRQAMKFLRRNAVNSSKVRQKDGYSKIHFARLYKRNENLRANNKTGDLKEENQEPRRSAICKRNPRAKHDKLIAYGKCLAFRNSI